MPIELYTGLQGSGKTYAMVKECIMPALRTPRKPQHDRIHHGSRGGLAGAPHAPCHPPAGVCHGPHASPRPYRPPPFRSLSWIGT